MELVRLKIEQGTKTTAKEVELGTRKISRMNFSYIVTIPKIFVQNTANGKIITLVRITMLEDGCLKLTPLHEKSDSDDFVVM